MKKKERLINDIAILADASGWDFIIHDDNGKMISFSKDKKRINVYYTTMTIGVCIPKSPQKYYRKVTIENLEKLFLST